MFTHKYRNCLLVALLAALVLVMMVPTVYAEPMPPSLSTAPLGTRAFSLRDVDSDGDSDVDGADFLQHPVRRHQQLPPLMACHP